MEGMMEQTRQTIKTPDGTIRDPRQAFDTAIANQVLSVDPNSPRYAGHWMYMYHDHAGRAQFKHNDTRKYLSS